MDTLQIRSTEALIDSLLTVEAFDSVLTLIPPVLRDAQVRSDSALLSKMFTIRGRAEFMIGRTREGFESIDHALHIAQSSRDTTTWMTALGVKGLAHCYRGQFEECLELNQTRLFLAQKSHNQLSEARARLLIGYVHLVWNKLEKAKTEYSLSVDLFRALNMKKAALDPLIGLGRVFSQLEEIDEARDCFHQVLLDARELGDLVNEAHAVNNLGTLEYIYGDMGLAAQYFERAYELNKTARFSAELITPATNVAYAKTYLGDYDGAAKILEDAIQTCETTGYRQLHAMALNKLGSVRLLQNRINGAALLYRQSLSLGDALSRTDYNDAVVGLAKSLIAMDSTHVAIELLSDALDSSPTQRYRQHLCLLLSNCLRRTDRAKEALRWSLDAENQSRKTGDNRMMISLAFELCACNRMMGRLDEAYEWCFRGMDLFENFREITEDYQWREASSALLDLVDRTKIVLEYPPDRPVRDCIEALFNILQRFKARTLLERITEPRFQSDLESDISKLSPIVLHELQQNVLNSGELLLDFAVGNDESYMFAVTRDSCRLIMLPGRRSDFPVKINLYCKALGNLPGRKNNGGKCVELTNMQETLGELILDGVGDLLIEATRVYIAPDLYFNALPFGTLMMTEKTGTKQALIETKELMRIPSPTILRWLRTRKSSSQRSIKATQILAVTPVGGGELKGAKEEVEFLKDRFADVTQAEGKEAEMSFGEMQYNIVHVATHVEINDNKPWHSGILLGKLNDTPARDQHSPRRESNMLHGKSNGGIAEFKPDPYLRAGEIARLHIPARLAVLAGCESALGQMSIREGVLGLTSAFLSAGVTSVVSTLWPVDDRVTAELMKIFYRELARGKTVASALRSAQFVIRGRRDTSHPFYWAGFIIVGDGNVTVPLEENPYKPMLLYILGVIALLLLMFAAAWARRRSGLVKKNKTVGVIILLLLCLTK